MKWKFETKNLHEALYKRAIRYYMYEAAGTKNWKKYNDVTIKIRPMSMASEDRFFDRDGIGGYFGGKELVLYVVDMTGDFAFLTNMMMISIESAHMVLFYAGRTERVALRHHDAGGNPAGTKLPFYVAEVHDRHNEKKIYMMNFWLWSWRRLFIPRQIYARVVDIRDIV